MHVLHDRVDYSTRTNFGYVFVDFDKNKALNKYTLE